MVVHISTTFGYESFAKGIKTFFISYDPRKINQFKFKPIKFGYLGKFKKTGFFGFQTIIKIYFLKR